VTQPKAYHATFNGRAQQEVLGILFAFRGIGGKFVEPVEIIVTTVQVSCPDMTREKHERNKNDSAKAHQATSI
jgi:hypothetical protein